MRESTVLSLSERGKRMSGVKIIDVKFIALCSRHRNEGDEIPRYADGRVVEDKDIACIAEALGDPDSL